MSKSEKKWWPGAGTIGARTCELILELYDDETGRYNVGVILQKLYDEFEHCNSSEKSVYWYANKLRKHGYLPPAKRLTKAQRAANKAAVDAAWRERKRLERENRKAIAAQRRAAKAEGK